MFAVVCPLRKRLAPGAHPAALWGTCTQWESWGPPGEGAASGSGGLVYTGLSGPWDWGPFCTPYKMEAPDNGNRGQAHVGSQCLFRIPRSSLAHAGDCSGTAPRCTACMSCVLGEPRRMSVSIQDDKSQTLCSLAWGDGRCQHFLCHKGGGGVAQDAPNEFTAQSS